MDESRAAAVAALRTRLARMGGLQGAPGPRRVPAPAGGDEEVRDAPPPGRVTLGPPQALGPSLEVLGFVPELTPAGLAWVRRVSVELAPFLEAAAAPAPVSPAQLLRLSLGSREAQPAPGWDEGEVAVLDIESLGLRGSGVVAFLVGVGVPSGSRLEVDQLLLADLDAEPAQLLALLTRLARSRMLVTYNGRTFDLPVLRSRAVVNRLHAWAEPPLHCDLLAPVRRLFRDRLGVCTLRQAEQALLGLHREDDLSGAEAPGRYRWWLREGAVEVLEGVLRHNQLDLCATMVLGARLAAHVEGRLVQPAHPADRYRLGVHLERGGGVSDDVDAHLRAAALGAGPPWGREASLRLARRLQRRDPGSVAEAVQLLRRLVDADPGDLRAARQLAIALERAGALEEALEVSRRALAACERLGDWRTGRMRAAPASGWRADWESRHRRVAARLARRRSGHGRGRRQAQMPPPLVAGAEVGGALLWPVLAY